MRKFPAVAAAVLATVPFVGVTAQPASAAQPATAKTWSALMYNSLNPSPEAIKLRTMLPVMRRTVIDRRNALAQAVRAQGAAQAAVAAATSGTRLATKRYAAATVARDAAKKADRPKANATVKLRHTQLGQSVTALRVAQTGLRNTTAKATAANDAWHAATVAVRNAEQKIAASGYDPTAAAQAAKISAQVVTDTRAGFTIDDTTQIYGITINKTIAYAFQRMLDDAAHDGVPLSGGGFRTKERQIELRVINGCPDIWTAPASSCRVPTAIPGRSLHEIGLAIDLTYGGKTIGSRDGVAFKWLAANAARYGLVNLPSEPWHWSITGS
ncbi:M15 family metallopeptidase [Paractinoplanes globisporus]|uniref:M15 family metallopeptidase n=1 Tax=Paractinoplanes globisporus TaxID=113565 RepID=A0ABW6W678_9ACTN|nr:M15 family metallopeptidase [Actinoplanes globisporus]